MNWDDFFEWLMDREGRSITDNRTDPGGLTAWGISRRYNPGAAVWTLVDKGVTSGAVFEGAVKDFYWRMLKFYWNTLPDRLRIAYCDAVVNMGAGKKGDRFLGATELLQHAMNRLAGSHFVDVDGVFGPQTRAAVKTFDPGSLAFSMCAFRLVEYNGRPSAKYNLSGWINRVEKLMEVL